MKKPPRDYRIVTSPHYNIKVFDYWGDCYESIFLMFKPFFKFKLNSGYSIKKFNVERSKMLKILLNECEPVRWHEIKERGSFHEYSEIDDGLNLSPDNLKNKIRLEELSEKLGILYPFEDFFSPYQVDIVQEALKYLGYKNLCIGDEFLDTEEAKILNIDLESDNLIFTSNIYSKDNKILFTSPYDMRYSFICSERKMIEEIKDKFCIEGFFCNANTATWWSRKSSEVERFEE